MTQHPQENLIKAFSKGDLIPPLAAMVSAHIEKCTACRVSYNELLKLEAKSLENEVHDLSVGDVDVFFDSVINKISSVHEPLLGGAVEDAEIEISGKIVKLPRALNFLKDQNIPWKEFGKKNAIAPVTTTQEGNFYLIYIGPGEKVPNHGHSGLEYSYVAAGSYVDGISEFNTGDFSVSGSDHVHSPQATSSDGCLIISWVEGRLDYFHGILRPLNSLLWWYLHRA